MVEQGRAVGVELVAADGTVSMARAGTVVSSAGAVGSVELLRRSGIAPADELLASGLDVVADAPGMGTAGANHPAIDLLFEPPPGVVVDDAPLLQGALHLTTPGGVPVEVLALCRPYGRATGDAPHDPTLSLRVSVMASARGVRIGREADRPTIDARYLQDPGTRDALRDAVRAVTGLALSPSFGDVLGTWLGPDGPTVATDAALDEWIAGRLGTSMHLCSTVPMGPATDPSAVVDQLGWVRGVEGLRVVDTSILPSAPTRGPACSAIVLAEHLASTFD